MSSACPLQHHPHGCCLLISRHKGGSRPSLLLPLPKGTDSRTGSPGGGQSRRMMAVLSDTPASLARGQLQSASLPDSSVSGAGSSTIQPSPPPPDPSSARLADSPSPSMGEATQGLWLSKPPFQRLEDSRVCRIQRGPPPYFRREETEARSRKCLEGLAPSSGLLPAHSGLPSPSRQQESQGICVLRVLAVHPSPDTRNEHLCLALVYKSVQWGQWYGPPGCFEGYRQ